jgi:hypothetical protein
MATKKEFTSSEEEKWEKADQRNCRLAARVLYYSQEEDIYEIKKCWDCGEKFPTWHFVDWNNRFHMDCRVCRQKKQHAWWLENSRECSSCHERQGLSVFGGKDICKDCRLAASLRRLDVLLETSEEAKAACALIMKWYKERYASATRCIKCRHRKVYYSGFRCWPCRFDDNSDDD